MEPSAEGYPRLPTSVKTSGGWRTKSCSPNSWVFVGFAHELEKPGDVTPVTVGGKPIFLIRNSRDEIGCYHNVCRHRCLKIIDKTANVGPRIRCPYHSWVYNLDGELQSTPFFGGPETHMPEDFDAKEQGLVPVRTGVWHDWIFANLSGTAADFGDFIAPMETTSRRDQLRSAGPGSHLGLRERSTPIGKR